MKYSIKASKILCYYANGKPVGSRVSTDMIITKGYCNDKGEFAKILANFKLNLLDVCVIRYRLYTEENSDLKRGLEKYNPARFY